MYICKLVVCISNFALSFMLLNLESRSHSQPFDERAELPPNTGLLGGIHATPITDFTRPRIVELCKVALEKYNAENQVTNYIRVCLSRFIYY